MTSQRISTIFSKIVPSFYVVALLVFFVASMLFLPYELFFLSAVIILVVMRSLEKNVQKFSSQIDHGQ